MFAYFFSFSASHLFNRPIIFHSFLEYLLVAVSPTDAGLVTYPPTYACGCSTHWCCACGCHTHLCLWVLHPLMLGLWLTHPLMLSLWLTHPLMLCLWVLHPLMLVGAPPTDAARTVVLPVGLSAYAQPTSILLRLLLYGKMQIFS